MQALKELVTSSGIDTSLTEVLVELDSGVTYFSYNMCTTPRTLISPTNRYERRRSGVHFRVGSICFVFHLLCLGKTESDNNQNLTRPLSCWDVEPNEQLKSKERNREGLDAPFWYLTDRVGVRPVVGGDVSTHIHAQ